jgi:hypothetical protein
MVLALLLTLGTTSGCAMLRITAAGDPGSTPNGVRVYAPRTYVLVDGSVAPSSQTTIVTLPDLCRGYDVRPWTIFSKQDFKIELDDGHQMKTLTANQDTTAFLTFMKEAASLAAKASGLPVGTQTINGTFGLANGVYVFTDRGELVMLYDARRAPGSPEAGSPLYGCNTAAAK